MNKNFFRKGVVLTIFTMLILIGASSVSARPFTTDFTGTSSCVDVPGTGEFTVIDGKLHITGLEDICADATSDLRVSGEDRIVINALLDLNDNLSGPMWGSATITNGGGSWKGNWTGNRTSEGFAYIRMSAQGLDGYKGMHAWWDLERLSANPADPYSLSGYILEPGQ